MHTRFLFEGMRKMVMNCLMQGVPSRREPRPVKRQEQKEKDSGILTSQRLILTWLTEYPGLFATVKSCVKPEDFSDTLYRKVASMLYEQLEHGEHQPRQRLQITLRNPSSSGLWLSFLIQRCRSKTGRNARRRLRRRSIRSWSTELRSAAESWTRPIWRTAAAY